MGEAASPREHPPIVPRVDGRAYLISASSASAASLVAGLLLSGLTLGDPGILLRMAASIVLGPDVVPISVGTTAPTLLVGLLVHLALSFVYAFIIVLVIYRWGMVIGLVGGALAGIALYAIAIYGLSYFFPWIYPLRNWMLLVSHMLLGGLIGMTYELLDRDDLPFPEMRG